MPDLTLQEALTEYEAECREVLGEIEYDDAVEDCRVWNMQYDTDTGFIIGACHQWLAGKKAPYMEYGYCYYSSNPLRFALDEVRAHMEDS